MRILLTNDDGIDAHGLHVLAAALRPLGEVIVAAPATNQTGVSRSITLSPTIAVDEVEIPGGSIGIRRRGHAMPTASASPCSGSPVAPTSSCRGRTAGVNLGDDVAYSGTVAAALEGVFLGPPVDRRVAAGVGGHRGLVRRCELRRTSPTCDGRRPARRSASSRAGCPMARC